MEIVRRRELWIHTHFVTDCVRLSQVQGREIEAALLPVLRQQHIVYGMHFNALVIISPLPWRYTTMSRASYLPILTINEWWEEHYAPGIGFGKELALAKLWAAMYYPTPGDADHRIGFVVAYISNRIESWHTTPETEVWATVAQLRLMHGFLTAHARYGGAERLNSLVPAERRGKVAGEVLRLTRRLVAHGYSGTVEEAIRILTSRYAQEGREGRSRHRLFDAWTHYRAVAPLWAALLVYEDSVEQSIEDRFSWCLQELSQYLPEFLGVAEGFRQFGISHIPCTKRQQRPLLDDDTTWRYTGAITVDSVDDLLPPLTPQEYAWLETRR